MNSDRPGSYWSDDFSKGMENAAIGDENWNLFILTFYDGNAGLAGDKGLVYNYMVSWNAKISKVNVVLYSGFLPDLDNGMRYSFEGTAKLPRGKIYEDSQILDGRYKPMTAVRV